MGSKDRRAVEDICYNYFRTAYLFKVNALADKLALSALFLDWDDLSGWYKAVAHLGITETGPLTDRESKLAALQSFIDTESFRFKKADLESECHQLNAVQLIDYRPANWGLDHRNTDPGHRDIPGCFMINEGQELNSSIQVQDLSSQLVCEKIIIEEGERVWDVCCGSGGKSLNLMMRAKGEFYMSDVRESILKNAIIRLGQYGYSARLGQHDLDSAYEQLHFGNEVIDHESFNVIVIDAPCSGSGTWFRNPEHYVYFNANEVSQYARRQRSILQHAAPFLRSGGKLYYITCSVFCEENRMIANWAQEHLGLELVDDTMLCGPEHQCDSMYMAEFSKG